MNREIKFRGKCVPDSRYAGEWVTGGYVAPEADCKKQDEGLIISYFGGNNTITCHVIPDTVGQYTGVKDMNGKEIYEGDIVEFDGSGSDYNTGKMLRDKAIVIYSNCSFVVDYSPSLRCSLSVLGFYNLVVIGNIYDNINLLNNQ